MTSLLPERTNGSALRPSPIHESLGQQYLGFKPGSVQEQIFAAFTAPDPVSLLTGGKFSIGSPFRAKPINVPSLELISLADALALRQRAQGRSAGIQGAAQRTFVDTGAVRRGPAPFAPAQISAADVASRLGVSFLPMSTGAGN